MELKELAQLAMRAKNLAYAPYSGFRVGAAILTKAGQVYSGANIENASYSLTICAERTAVFRAVLAGERQFVAIAVSGSGKDYIYPCGACLQVLAEFSPDIKIIVINEKGETREYYLKEMLPWQFSIKDK